jgi:hypothetical protein
MSLAPIAVYPMHRGAKTALYIAGGLTCLLIVTIPLGLFIIWRASRGRVELSAEGVTQYGLGSTRIRFSEVQRLGVLSIPIHARGLGGALARKKCGGPNGVNFCAMDRRGKTHKFVASMYENYGEIFERSSQATQRPVETLSMGALKLRWPDAAAA